VRTVQQTNGWRMARSVLNKRLEGLLHEPRPEMLRNRTETFKLSKIVNTQNESLV
jgi:hypothetical protein